MNLNSFNICSCGVLIEGDEFWCDRCHMFDMMEGDDTEIFLDGIFLEEQLNEDGELDIQGVSLKRRD